MISAEIDEKVKMQKKHTQDSVDKRLTLFGNGDC